jgi:type IV pilus modification protein PilV
MEVMARKAARAQRGVTIIELMIAIMLLCIGLLALVSVVYGAVITNNRNRLDSTATALAQQVMEQIIAQPAAFSQTMTITDCAGNSWTIKTAAGGANLYTSATAPTSSQVNNIDFTQTASGVPSGYQMSYVSCNANGINTTYDVRWNVTKITSQTRSVAVGAQPKVTANKNIFFYAPPVTLRTVAGQVP